MKKVLILQNVGNSYGGVWFVNKTIAEELIKNKYNVEILSIRDSHTSAHLEHDKNLNVSIVNKHESWEITRFQDIKLNLRKFNFIQAIKLSLKKIKEEIWLKRDYNIVKKYIKEKKFDYIITSHYQVLDCIPKEYLKRTIHEQHTSFETSINHKATKKMFDKYNGKIKFLWLSKNACDLAKKNGYLNSTYIYNPIKFNCKKKADVVKNKKLVAITRISTEKRIDLMINIVNKVLQDSALKDWTLEIYGDGPLISQVKKIDYDKKRIKLMGLTNDSEKVLLSSSINLNTSLFEGFSMGILEATECGVPSVSFRFGESADEEITKKTGIIVEQNNIEKYKSELIKLMKDEGLLEKMSINCKKFSKKFDKKVIIQDWIKLFNNL